MPCGKIKTKRKGCKCRCKKRGKCQLCKCAKCKKGRRTRKRKK